MKTMKPRVDTRVYILIFGTVLLITAWAAILSQDSRSRELRVVSAMHELSNYARLVEAHTRSIIRGLDQVVMHLKAVYEDDPSSFDLSPQVSRSPILKGLAVQAGIIGASGYLESTTSAVSGQKLYLGDREHFRVFEPEANGEDKPNDSLYISKPVLGRASGKWSIQLARRLNDKSGKFAGVVVVSLDPGYISSIYQQIKLGPDSSITVVGRDGIVRARAAGEDRTVGQDIRERDYFAGMWASTEGEFRTSSPLLPGVRVGVYRRMDDYPLAVIVARSGEGIEVAHGHDHRVFLVAGLISTLLISVGTLLLWWEAGRQLATQNRLRSREQELTKTQVRLELHNRDLGQFAEVLAHHLQEPVRIQYINTQRLQRLLGDNAGGDVYDLLNNIQGGALRLRSLLRDVQLYLAIGQQPPVASACSAEEALTSALVRCAETTKAAGALVSRSPLPRVHIGSRLLTDLFYVLIENAVVHRVKGVPPQVHVSATVEDEWAEFVVSDNGPGIPEEYHQRVFRVFERLDPHSGSGNTGIGLALAQKIVESVQGRIWITTSPTGGTRMCFRIPLGDTTA